MLIALIVVAVLAAAVVGIGLADRSIAALAERAASTYLAEPFGQPPTVRVHATPFVTQALRGRYRDVEVAADGRTAVRHEAHLVLRHQLAADDERPRHADDDRRAVIHVPDAVER